MKYLLLAPAALVVLAAGLVAAPSHAGEIATLTGRLVDDDHRPVAGIEVQAQTAEPERTVDTTTDSAGRYRFSVPEGPDVHLLVRDPNGRFTACSRDLGPRDAAGEQSEIAQVPATTHAIGDRQLCQPAIVSGRLVDADGKPVVEKIDFNVQGHGTVSDAHGRFRISVFAGLYRPVVQADAEADYVPASLPVDSRKPFSVKAGQKIDLGTQRLPRPGIYGSIATHAEGVSVQPVIVKGGGYVGGRPTTLPGFPVLPGTYRVSTSNGWIGGRSYASARDIVVKAGRTTWVTPPRTRTASLGYRFYDDRGDQVSDLFLTLRRHDDPVEVIGTVLTEAGTDATFNGVVVGPAYDVTVHDPLRRYPDQLLRSTHLGAPSHRPPAPQKAWQTSSGEFVGLAYAPSSRAPADGVIEVFDADSTGGPIAVTSAGSFQTDILPPGRYVVRYRDPVRRLKTAWFGGGTSRTTAHVFRTNIGVPKVLPFLSLEEAVHPRVQPAITGRATRRHVLSRTVGSWGGSPTSFTTRWLRDGRAIPGATGRRYRLTSNDVGHRITVRVSGHRGRTVQRATSAPRRVS